MPGDMFLRPRGAKELKFVRTLNRILADAIASGTIRKNPQQVRDMADVCNCLAVEGRHFAALPAVRKHILAPLWHRFGVKKGDGETLAAILWLYHYGKDTKPFDEIMRTRGRPLVEADVANFAKVTKAIDGGLSERAACRYVAKGDATKTSRLRRAFRRWNKNQG
jgi:hypothetical protein